MAFSSILSPVSWHSSFTCNSEAASLCFATFDCPSPQRRRSFSKFRGLNFHLPPLISASRTVATAAVSPAAVANSAAPVTSFTNVIGLIKFAPFSFPGDSSFENVFFFFFSNCSL